MVGGSNRWMREPVVAQNMSNGSLDTSIPVKELMKREKVYLDRRTMDLVLAVG